MEERKEVGRSWSRISTTAWSRLANLWTASMSSPMQCFRYWAGIAVAFGIIALTIGFAANVFQVRILDMQRFWFIPLVLVLFPSIPEEFLFRGLLVPRDVLDSSKGRAAAYVFGSTLIFTLSRPLYELTISGRSQPIFLNPYFLAIIFLLGITCCLGYILSRSIWVPVFIHWLAALVWVLFLGGGSLILKNL